MAESSFASLNPTLLARKGGAKPAMRPQLGALAGINAGMGVPADAVTQLADHQLDDLGWNDMGEEETLPDSEIALITPAAAKEPSEAEPAEPPVRRQHEELARRVAPQEAAPPEEETPERRPNTQRNNRRAPRPSIKSHRSAFTLRLDAERHLRLRLASTIENRSAQAIVTEALDALLDRIPELEQLASRVERT